MEVKLDERQSLTIESLVGERDRLARRIQGINDALKHYTEEWADGQEGPFVFNKRADGLYLEQIGKDDETSVAPAE